MKTITGPVEKEKRILVTGATGYVGGKLAKALTCYPYRLRCLVRDPLKLYQPVLDAAEVVQGNVLDPNSLAAALEDVDTAFYLIHSMAAGVNFAERDRLAANHFVQAAKSAGVKRIIYLGGLGDEQKLSAHLASRQEVGRIFAKSGITTLEFRASIIIGVGSVSFEMIRTLVEKLPVMVTPRWVQTEAQPIAIEDVIGYLLEAIEVPLEKSRIFEIGGPERISYKGLMVEYAHQRHLHRLMIPVPVLTPYLSSLWLRFVTPLYVRIGRALIEGIRNPTIVKDPSSQTFFSVKPRTIQEAMRRSLQEEDNEFVNYRACQLHSKETTTCQKYTGRQGSRIIESYAVTVPTSPKRAFETIEQIGGSNGWHYANWLWHLRGWIDQMAGGVGMRQTQRKQAPLVVGDQVDFWCVDAIETGRLLRLRAEMKLPGQAWLQFETELRNGKTVLCQTAIFKPHGLAGLMYWYGAWPFHWFIFKGMIKAVANRISANH
ncbi:MAG: SDR family oxidoreductase [Planctomycetota bacterium]|jgi:uncharacterized protein YbjT (DUF2867 family)